MRGVTLKELLAQKVWIPYIPLQITPAPQSARRPNTYNTMENTQKTIEHIFQWCETGGRAQALVDGDSGIITALELMIAFELPYDEYKRLPGEFRQGKAQEIIQYYAGFNPGHPFASMVPIRRGGKVYTTQVSRQQVRSPIADVAVGEIVRKLSKLDPKVKFESLDHLERFVLLPL